MTFTGTPGQINVRAAEGYQRVFSSTTHTHHWQFVDWAAQRAVSMTASSGVQDGLYSSSRTALSIVKHMCSARNLSPVGLIVSPYFFQHGINGQVMDMSLFVEDRCGQFQVIVQSKCVAEADIVDLAYAGIGMHQTQIQCCREMQTEVQLQELCTDLWLGRGDFLQIFC